MLPRHMLPGKILPEHMLPGQMLLWQLASVKVCPRILPLKFGQNWFSKSWDIPNMDKCCLYIYMSLGELKSVLDVPRSLSLKFGQNWVSDSWDIAVSEFLVVVGDGGFRDYMVCKPILVFSFSLSQTEQFALCVKSALWLKMQFVLSVLFELKGDITKRWLCIKNSIWSKSTLCIKGALCTKIVIWTV